MHKVIGIDLGTTYSAVAAWDPDQEEAVIITDKTVDRGATTPSVVSLHPVVGKVVVGQAAKQNLANDPDNTIIEIKREMGAEFTAQTLAKYRAEEVFKVGEPVKARFVGEWRLPQEISAFTLLKMKEIAEAEIGEEVIDAVVTVPAYFTEKQKKATQEAALLAGLYPRQLVPEPTAAAICYGVDKQEDERRIYLVYDLGGGTFDVSIISVEGTDIEVLATSGDSHLGGGDFDDAVTAWAIDALRKRGQDFSGDFKARARIKLKAEQAKIILSDHNETTLDLAELNPADPPRVELTRAQLVQLIEPSLRKSVAYVEDAINRAKAAKGVSREDISAILLVGGSSKIPAVKEMLLDYFQKDAGFIRDDLNPDEVVARGAALLANRFAPTPPPFNAEAMPPGSQLNLEAETAFTYTLITEHSLGVGVADDQRGPYVARIIRLGSNIPISESRDGFVNGGPWTECPVEVYQGESENIHECTKIGTLVIGPIEPKPKGEHHFEVTFNLDENGLLSATVLHLNENRPYSATFQQNTGVGGLKKLGFLNKQLREFYIETPPDASPDDYVPAPPPGVAAGAGAPRPPAGPAAAAGAAPAPPAEAAAGPVPGSATEAEAAGAPPAAAIVEPTTEVPAEFRVIRRRAVKQLDKQPDQNLLDKLNAFTEALNGGADGAALEQAGDELADALDDARLRTA